MNKKYTGNPNMNKQVACMSIIQAHQVFYNGLDIIIITVLIIRAMPRQVVYQVE
jgi:hypothetical protein